MRPTHLDLFSGIGGFSLAAEAAGFETVAFSEIDPYASAVLRKHWPNVPNLGDITKHSTWPELGRIDLLTGGFPCQSFSCAGKRRGSADDRYLWPAMLEVIKRYRPAWVCGENVAGITGLELLPILSSLEGLRYQCQPLTIPACAVGAQHARCRVFILAHCHGLRELQPQGSKQNIGRRTCNKDFYLANGDSFGRYPATIQRGKHHSGREAKSARRAREKQKQLEPFPPNGEPLEALLTPDACGAPYGLQDGVDRIRCLGNAIVPQVAEVILKAIREQIA